MFPTSELFLVTNGASIAFAFAIVILMAFPASPSHIEYSTVTGYFVQDEPATNPLQLSFSDTGFGLINRPYDTDADFDPHHEKTQWERFGYHLDTLNRDAPPNTEFKLLFLGRHGEGYHNVAEAFYGTVEWDCYWSMLEGNGTVTWADPRLTDAGIKQIEVIRDTWAEQMKHGIRLPQSYYTSPLLRCLETADITFGSLSFPGSRPFGPTIKELLRETLGIHTCDRRSSRTKIAAAYPTFPFEDNFVEDDPLWDADFRESNSARTARLQALLDDIFTHDRNTVLSLTAHSGAIESILEVIKHRKYGPPTGGVVPFLVRAEVKQGARQPGVVDPPTRAPPCPTKPILQQQLN